MEKKKGRLKIFFGCAAGVGKTYAMLQAAHTAKQRGVDVVCGFIPPYAPPRTRELMRGLEQLGMKQFSHDGITVREFDLDAAIARRPQLILVDELAHINAEGSRHARRFQDIKELLDAGIDVYTTVNVQNIESLNDMVASITGRRVQERIPDSVFDQADQVELVDIEPQELLERLHGWTVCQNPYARKTGAALPGRENGEHTDSAALDSLVALRELALRRCADRVNLLTESGRGSQEHSMEEQILVCLSPSPSNDKIIRTAARMANAFRAGFIALYVESPRDVSMKEESRIRLREHIRLAQQLGAKLETVYGDDVPYQIAEFARLAGVSKIVIGRSAAAPRGFFRKLSLTDRVIQYAPSLDVYVIPDAAGSARAYRDRYNAMSKRAIFSPLDVGKCVIVLEACTCIGLLFKRLGLTDANIVAVYILGVLVSAIFTRHQIYSVIASFASVMTFNFFFTEPRFTFAAHDAGYPVTFFIMFAVGIISSSLAIKLKESARLSSQAAYRTKVLFDTNQLLQQAREGDAILAVTAGQLIKLLNRSIVLYPVKGDGLDAPRIYPAPDTGTEAGLTGAEEQRVACWVLCNNRQAGASTDTFSAARCRYLAIRAGGQVYGVVGIDLGGEPLDAFENSILLSILGECALALENERNAREKEEAAVLARNEQLRSNLLRAISHDLRTPLTSISGNASNLMSNWKNFSQETVMGLFTDIYDDAMWLINLVENLLSVTRLEEGRLHLNLVTELLDDIIQEALHHLNRLSAAHSIQVRLSDDLLLIRGDAKLIVQVFINIIDNAVKYTQADSAIRISAAREGSMIRIRIADNGPGIPDEQKGRIFERFYTNANRAADSRRSLGLGLSLCRSIVNAHGGQIWVEDNKPCGTVFTFTLPAGEVQLHE